MLISAKELIKKHVLTPAHIAPLAVLRIAFGSIMLISTIRFLLKGWVYSFYIKPKFHFTFYGFDWVKPFGPTGMYVLFGLMVVSSVMVIAGLLYKVASTAFFLTFTYVELIDKTTYLNHYYFVSVMAFLLILVPAGRYFSVDVWLKPAVEVSNVPAWTINIFKLQLILVYFFAGISKLNHDWLIDTMPLKIWLPGLTNLWLVGPLLGYTWVAYAFSWFGALFDLTIGFLLLKRSTRKPAYVMVIIFHIFTAWFFKIGMFPYIMIAATLIFFSAETHKNMIDYLRRFWFRQKIIHTDVNRNYLLKEAWAKLIYGVLIIHFTIQVLLPLRYLAYPGKLYWTEEGYRFSWRVMLMEKGGTIFFYVKDPATGGQTEIVNSQYLSQFQETQMSTQPDMILQFAHYLAGRYRAKGIKNPVVTAQSYVTLNGSGSRLYIDSTVNLANERESFGHKRWILPFQKN